MEELEKSEYKEILKKLKKISIKNNDLLQMNEYLVSSLKSNIVINGNSINNEETDFIEEKITHINNSLNNKLIPRIQGKISE